MTTPTPTPQQAAALRAAADHPEGLITRCGTVVRRNLLAHGWVVKKPRVQQMRNARGGTTEFRTTVYVINDDGRAAIGAAPVAVDLDAQDGPR